MFSTDVELTLRGLRNERYDGPDGTNVWVTIQGQRLSVQVQRETLQRAPTGERGVVLGFSDGSRFRCLKFVAGIDWSKAGESYFLTLGYPDHIDWTKYETRQLHLSNFQTHIRRHYKRNIAFLWRTEWVPRLSGKCVGEIAPHHHLLVFNAPCLTKMNVWHWWMQSIGERDYANVGCEELYNSSRVGLYIAKYAAKQPCILGYDTYLGNVICGRSWGARYKTEIPMHRRIEIRTTLNEKTEAVMHAVRGEATCWALGYNDSFTVLGPAAEAMGAYLQRFTVDGELPVV